MAPRPLNLPSYVIFMTTAATRQLAFDVAALMTQLDSTVYVDDFEAPLYDAYAALWGTMPIPDYADPKISRALRLESRFGHSDRDIIGSLRKWFDDEFDGVLLGRMAVERALEVNVLEEYIYLFRDGDRISCIAFDDAIKAKKVHESEVLYFYLDQEKLDDPAAVISKLEELYGAR